MGKAVYWAVILGDRLLDKTGSTIPTSGPNKRAGSSRVTFGKHIDIEEACRECWGVYGDDLWMKDLGSNKAVFSSSLKSQYDARNPDKGFWFRVGGGLYWEDGKLVEE